MKLYVILSNEEKVVFRIFASKIKEEERFFLFLNEENQMIGSLYKDEGTYKEAYNELKWGIG